MGRIEGIIDVVTKSDGDLESALLQCRVLARRLKHDPLESWANRELDGYSSLEDLPDYRIFKSIPRGYYTNGAWSVQNKSVDPNVVGREYYETLRTIPIMAGIKNLIAQRHEGNLSLLLNQHEGAINGLYALHVDGDYGFINLHLPVPPGAYDSIIGTVRNRLVSLLLDMSEVFPDDYGLASPTAEQRQEFDKSFTQNIYNINNTGDMVLGSNAQIQKSSLTINASISPGNAEELSKFLMDQGLAKSDIDEIEPLFGYIYEDSLNPKQESALQTWIERMATRLSSATKNTSKEVATSLIAQALISYAPEAASVISRISG